MCLTPAHLNPSAPFATRPRLSVPLLLLPLLPSSNMMPAPLASSMPSILRGLLLLLLLSLFQPTAGQAPATFTLPWEPGYNLLSGCGKSCLYGAADVWIGGKLGCLGPYTNDCMCRIDKAPTISSYASECNKNYCTNGGDAQQDINTFLSLYNSYCAKNGYTLPGGAAFAEPTGGGGSMTIIGESTAATVTRVTHATRTAPSSGGTKLGTTSLGKWGGALAVAVSVWVITVASS